MKDKFLGYYWSDEDYENEVWENGMLVMYCLTFTGCLRILPMICESLKSIRRE